MSPYDRLKQLQWSELSPSLQEQLMKTILTISPSRFSRKAAEVTFRISIIAFLAGSEMKWERLSPSVQDLFFQISEIWLENLDPRATGVWIHG
jgi:hypothetical protein